MSQARWRFDWVSMLGVVLDVRQGAEPAVWRRRFGAAVRMKSISRVKLAGRVKTLVNLKYVYSLVIRID
jgi:hypothetical protein